MGKTTKSLLNVDIPEPKIRVVMVDIVGATPLISHRFSDKTMQLLEDKETGKARNSTRGSRMPEEEFKECLYIRTDGKYGFPGSAFHHAAVGACCMVDGITKTLAGKAFTVVDDLAEIRSKKGPIMRRDIVFLPGMRGKKVASVRYRAEFPDWETTLTVRYNESIISAPQIINLLQLAGIHIGVGDWRPKFGGFNIAAKGKRKS